MIDRIITWSLEHRALVIAVAMAVVASGLWSLRRLPIDAYPDTTPVMVQINTTAPALSPLEIEQQVSFAVEQVISGLPGLDDASGESIPREGVSVCHSRRYLQCRRRNQVST